MAADYQQNRCQPTCQYHRNFGTEARKCNFSAGLSALNKQQSTVQDRFTAILNLSTSSGVSSPIKIPYSPDNGIRYLLNASSIDTIHQSFDQVSPFADLLRHRGLQQSRFKNNSTYIRHNSPPSKSNVQTDEHTSVENCTNHITLAPINNTRSPAQTTQQNIRLNSSKLEYANNQKVSSQHRIKSMYLQIASQVPPENSPNTVINDSSQPRSNTTVQDNIAAVQQQVLQSHVFHIWLKSNYSVPFRHID